jgi:serine/threonine protein kinase/Flp pilus assembly protein TadD
MAPERISHYRILSRLGEGGIGVVFLAEDEKLRRQVAIKRLRPDAAADPHACQRMLVEARAVARLDHPHICGIYEVDEDAAGPFIVMPVVQGETLSARLANGPLPIGDAVEIGAHIADALTAAHGQGILHRDIKPANVIIAARGQVRVMDFGIAKFTGDAACPDPAVSTQLTMAGTTLGTAAYMSPEQARGERADTRSDLFSLGVVLYEMVAGRRPFDGRSLAGILTATQTEEPPPLARFRPDAPDALQRIISKALKKSPDERYQSAADLLVDLRAIGGGLQAPRARRSRTMAVLAGMAAVLLIAAGVLLARMWSSARQSASRTSEEIGSLAVLPFANNTGNADMEYLADGITESLTRNLSQVPNLKVLSRNTMFKFKGRSSDAQAISRDLGVRAVMTGALSRVDNQLVVELELSDAADARVLLSKRYVHSSANVLDLEADISRDAVKSLRAKLAGADAEELIERLTTSGEAYELYLRGRFFHQQMTPESLHKAAAQYELAIKADPNFAFVYAQQAAVYITLGTYFESPTENMTKARGYERRALALNPDLIEAHIGMGMISLLYDWDWTAAAGELTTVSGLKPQAAESFSCSAHVLQGIGRVADAEREIHRALDLDPLSTQLNTELGCNAYYRRGYDEAVREEMESLKLDPRNLVAYYNLARAYGQKAMYKEAIDVLRKAETITGEAPPLLLSEMGYANAKSGNTAAAQDIVRKLGATNQHTFVDPSFFAIVYIGLGDQARALDWLEKAYTARSGLLVGLEQEPKWDSLRSTPRFQALVKRVGLSGNGP